MVHRAGGGSGRWAGARAGGGGEAEVTEWATRVLIAAVHGGVISGVGWREVGGSGRSDIVLVLLRNGMHTTRTRGRGAGVPKGITARKVARHTRLAGMSLGDEEFVALALEAALEEVGTELQDVARFFLDYFAVEGSDFVGVVAGERHWKGQSRGCGSCEGFRRVDHAGLLFPVYGAGGVEN